MFPGKWNPQTNKFNIGYEAETDPDRRAAYDRDLASPGDAEATPEDWVWRLASPSTFCGVAGSRRYCGSGDGCRPAQWSSSHASGYTGITVDNIQK